jgi:hypothetical protein
MATLLAQGGQVQGAEVEVDADGGAATLEADAEMAPVDEAALQLMINGVKMMEATMGKTRDPAGYDKALSLLLQAQELAPDMESIKDNLKTLRHNMRVDPIMKVRIPYIQHPRPSVRRRGRLDWCGARRARETVPRNRRSP